MTDGKLIQTVDASETNAFGEPLYLPRDFVHPGTGKYRNEDEAFFADRAVRIFIDIEIQGAAKRIPVWLDVIRFEDQIFEDGGMGRLGLGRTQRTVAGDNEIAAGMELSFHPAEVFDVTDKKVKHEGIYVPLAGPAVE